MRVLLAFLLLGALVSPAFGVVVMLQTADNVTLRLMALSTVPIDYRLVYLRSLYCRPLLIGATFDFSPRIIVFSEKSFQDGIAGGQWTTVDVKKVPTLSVRSMSFLANGHVTLLATAELIARGLTALPDGFAYVGQYVTMYFDTTQWRYCYSLQGNALDKCVKDSLSFNWYIRGAYSCSKSWTEIGYEKEGEFNETWTLGP